MNKDKSQYFRDLDIDPYKVVGVKRKCTKKELKDLYIKKALVLHPDKTNGKTEVQFKLLNECYNYIKDVLNGKISNTEYEINNSYKQNFKDASEESFNYTRSKLDYNDSNTRKTVFVNHGLPSDVSDSSSNLDRIFGSRNKINQEYTPNDIYKTNKQNNIFANEAFTSDKFNAAFDIHKEKFGCNTGYDPNEYDEIEGFQPESCMQPLEILTHGGLIIEKPQNEYNKLNFKDLNNYKSNSQDISKLKNKKAFKQKLSQKKEQAISKADFDKLTIKKQTEKYVNDNSISFEEANQRFYEQKVKKMKDEMENNKKIINQNLGVYEPEYIEMYKQGMILDSSTAFLPEIDPFLDSFTGKKSIANSSSNNRDDRDYTNRDSSYDRYYQNHY